MSPPQSPREEAPAPAPTADDRNLEILNRDAKELLDEARWLHSYHMKRGESVQQRATAVLGFAGVLITLMPSTMSVVNAQGLIRVIGLLAVSASAVLAAATLIPAGTRILAAEQLHIQVEEMLGRAGEERLGLQVLQAARNLTYHAPRDGNHTPRRRNRPAGRIEPRSLIEAEARFADRRTWALFASAAMLGVGIVVLMSAVVSSVVS